MIETGTVTVTQIPTVSLNDATVCLGESIMLSPTPSASGGTYLWSPNGEISESITVVPLIDVVYSVIYTLNGCESSSVSSNIFVTDLPDATTTVADNIITASLSGAAYSWLDCDNSNSVIMGESGQSFAPTSNGNYAVEVLLNDCSDISECTTISTIGIEENTLVSIILYPNPVTESIHIESSIRLIDEVFQIIDAVGKVVKTDSLNDSQLINVNSLTPGIYSLRIKAQHYRFVK